MSSIDIESRVLSSLINGDICWLCLENLDSDVTDIYHPNHIVMPLARVRGDTCSHLVHQHCAIELLSKKSEFAWINWMDGSVSLGHLLKCYCGIYCTHFVSADISLCK